MIHSLLDQDLYKLTMLQVYFHRFRAVDHAEFRFHCRTAKVDLRHLKEPLTHQLKQLCRLRFRKKELAWLQTLGLFQNDFITFLRHFSLNMAHVFIGEENQQLTIRFRGPLLAVCQFEVFTLAILNELHTRHTYPQPDYDSGRQRLDSKINALLKDPQTHGLTFADFGTRRRFNRNWQQVVLTTLKQRLPRHLSGTSNMVLARELGLPAIGTMAHEFFQACQVLAPTLEQSQRFALKVWFEEYSGKLGIALSDVIGIEPFLRDFDTEMAQHYSGVRHDSGEPLAWAEKVLAHYRQLKIEPRKKTLVFSDGLTLQRAKDIYARLHKHVGVTFGIGTHLTNDLGHPPLSIVIKMSRCCHQPVAKISDSPGKAWCEDQHFLQTLRNTFNLPTVGAG
ncbi:MAG: nicotinate phosphoribosyltransferase [Deltaproteobacteria bacterium]|nr:nicotinate phosphoribosyltransferase [Deltaproteobacteria bacterium]